MPIFLAPLASFMVLLGTMLPSICEVIKASVKHGLQDIQGRWGIVKNVWFEAVEGIGASQGA
jgi:hypothetical protein